MDIQKNLSKGVKMKKKIMIICLAVLIAIGGTIAFSGDGEKLCGCGCNSPVVEGTNNCGCGWEPTEV